jgi:hypothetical protein
VENPVAHPYTKTIAGLVATVRQLRSAFPPTVSAETLRKWSIASNNEAPIIVVLRFLKLIDEEGKKLPENAKAFVEHEDTAFATKFEAIVRDAYTELFDTWGDAAWQLEKNKLIAFFRNADGTSARVGQEQAATFLALASLAGHGAPPPTTAQTSPKPSKAMKASKTAAVKPASADATNAKRLSSEGALSPAVTLRVEINRPVTEDQSVYDSIFKSIRAHLLNA